MCGSRDTCKFQDTGPKGLEFDTNAVDGHYLVPGLLKIVVIVNAPHMVLITALRSY